MDSQEKGAVQRKMCRTFYTVGLDLITLGLYQRPFLAVNPVLTDVTEIKLTERLPTVVIFRK